MIIREAKLSASCDNLLPHLSLLHLKLNLFPSTQSPPAFRNVLLALAFQLLQLYFLAQPRAHRHDSLYRLTCTGPLQLCAAFLQPFVLLEDICQHVVTHF